MEGLIEEGAEVMEEDYEGSVKDAALIGAAQRVEHCEIAGYGTVRSMAKTLGADDQRREITELAEQINTQAHESGDEQQDERQDEQQDEASSRDKKSSGE